MVADVIKSFDTVDRSILDCALGRLGLPSWFRKVCFAYHCLVKLQVQAGRLGMVSLGPGVGASHNPTRMPSSAWFLLWPCMFPGVARLEAMPGVEPQLLWG